MKLVGAPASSSRRFARLILRCTLVEEVAFTHPYRPLGVKQQLLLFDR